MTDIYKILGNSINLDRYGASSRFLGYFEKTGKYKPGMAEASVDFAIDFFGAAFGELTIASSLHANSDEVGHSGDVLEDNRDVLIIRRLVRAGMIKELSYDQSFGCSYETEKYKADVEAAWMAFHCLPTRDFETSDVRDLLLARMLVYGVHGHCFLVSDRLGLAFYPHDDMGFGVIGLHDEADLSAGIEFLVQAGRLQDHHSVIER